VRPHCNLKDIHESIASAGVRSRSLKQSLLLLKSASLTIDIHCTPT